MTYTKGSHFRKKLKANIGTNAATYPDKYLFENVF